MVSATRVIPKLAYAHQVLLEDLLRRLPKLGQKRLFDGHRDLAIVVLDVITDPTGFAAELCLVRGKVQSQDKPEQKEYRNDPLDSLLGCLNSDNGVVYVYLDISF